MRSSELWREALVVDRISISLLLVLQQSSLMNSLIAVRIAVKFLKMLRRKEVTPG